MLVLGQRLDGDVVAFCGFAERADGGLFAGDVGERVEVIPAHRVFEGHLVDLVIGHAVFGQHFVELFGGTGPHAVAVRVVGLPADVVGGDLAAQVHTDVIRDATGQKVLPKHLRRFLTAEV